jgi:ubiquinone/menaquinone biosynthesis C-methylase UbiE
MESRELYQARFKEYERLQKSGIWKVLCGHFFQKYIARDATVLDVGAGYCEFINNIQCGEKYAVDLNEDTIRFAHSDVKVFNRSSTNLDFLSDASVDVVFMSNFLEHLSGKDEVIGTLKEVSRVLKPRGRVLILQPNIKFLYKEYWDFFDHNVPLSDKSMVEALRYTGFEIERVVPKFLPYTTKSAMPKNLFLIKLYLKLPVLWRILGRQMFIIGNKK